jgi:hypothetical protein
MPHSTAISVLKFATFILIIFGGLVLAMASHPVAAFLPNLFFDLVFFPFDSAEKATEPVSRLLAALSGGAFVGFGFTFWLIITKLMPREPQLAKSMMTSGLLSWFVVDSTGSMLSGASFNVVLNCVILACFLVPLSQLELKQ